MTAEIDVIIGESALSLVYQGQEFLIATIDPDTDRMFVSAPFFDEIEWAETLDNMPTPDLHVNVRGQRKLARLKEKKTPAKKAAAVREVVTNEPEPPKSRWRFNGTELERTLSPLEEWERDQCLELIVDSWAKYPHQNKLFTAEESHRIAADIFGRDTKTNVMRVAGVRAALTRGAYDRSLEEMVAEYRKAHYDGGATG